MGWDDVACCLLTAHHHSCSLAHGASDALLAVVPAWQGHVVTNYHVIQNADAAQVTLANNKKYSATLRGYEGDKDLAVLKIDAPAEDLVPIEVGVSSRLVVGQRVFAIGEGLLLLGESVLRLLVIFGCFLDAWDDCFSQHSQKPWTEQCCQRHTLCIACTLRESMYQGVSTHTARVCVDTPFWQYRAPGFLSLAFEVVATFAQCEIAPPVLHVHPT